MMTKGQLDLVVRELLAVCLCLAALGCESRDATSLRPDAPPMGAGGIWISAEEIAALPIKGRAWEAMVAEANRPILNPDLSNQDDPNNVRVLAKAFVSIRTGDAAKRAEVRAACTAIQGTERGATALAVSRELMAYVVAADLVGLEEKEQEAFKAWLRRLQGHSFRGRTIRSTHEDRPNNWGTHAGASRLAMAIYLGDEDEILRAAHVLAGWLGEEQGWSGFQFGSASWQPARGARHGVNPVGTMRGGYSIDGVLPDDQRRGGPFSWPPPKENYVYEALQGVVVQAAMLERLGFRAWSWGDKAIWRALTWLDEQAHFPAEGDDTWIPHLVNAVYQAEAAAFEAPIPSRPGKGMGFTDWTHGSFSQFPAAD